MLLGCNGRWPVEHHAEVIHTPTPLQLEGRRLAPDLAEVAKGLLHYKPKFHSEALAFFAEISVLGTLSAVKEVPSSFTGKFDFGDQRIDEGWGVGNKFNNLARCR